MKTLSDSQPGVIERGPSAEAIEKHDPELAAFHRLIARAQTNFRDWREHMDSLRASRESVAAGGDGQ